MSDQRVTAASHDLTALRHQPLLAALSDEAFVGLLAGRVPRELAPGERLAAEGDTPDAAWLILDGAVEIARRAGGQEVTLGVREAGELVGEMGLLTGSPRNATLRARGTTSVLAFGREELEALLLAVPAATLALLRSTIGRLASAEAHLVQHQKMAALGVLAAGLAHELNNPAAAIVRSASQLRAAVADWESRAARLGATLPDEQRERTLATLRQDMQAHAGEPVWLDPLVRGDREQELIDWLATHGVPDGARLAPTLVDVGWDLELLRQLEEYVPAEQLAAVLGWLAAGQHVLRLLHELGAATTAISGIVGAVRSYTRLDQAPVQDVDLHEGLDQALAILRYKLRGVRVLREYAPDLPRLTAWASELNQAWTNLIDNAADALAGDGELRVRTAREGPRVLVEISDSGPGIPPEVRAHLFEPFFTTKPTGKGTGMGLSITWNIVRKHHGDIVVASEPGRTSISVRLPLDGVSA